MTTGHEETSIDPLPTAPPEGLRPGTLLNGLYRVEQRLGKGGMGEVYRATNVSDGKSYAIKAISQAISEHPEAIERFRREAQVHERIESTAVARLRMFCHDQTLGLFYFVLDFIEGESLLDRLKRQPASPEELNLFLRRMAAALAAVHDAQAVHRDISPDNIILPGGDVAQAKLIDFGIVKEIGDGQQTTGFEIGKYGYMPPEQLRIAPDNTVGPWSDLYSLALTALAFASGKPLDMGYSLNSAIEARQRPIDVASAPAALRPLLQRMLAFDWRERLRSAAEVVATLDGRSPPSALPTAAPAVTGPGQGAPAAEPIIGSEKPRPKLLPIALIAALIVALVIGGVFVARRAGDPDLTRLALPGLPTRTTPGGMKYQVVMPGDGTTRVPADGWADIATQLVQPTGAGGDLEEQRYRVPPDRVPPGLAEALALMTKGAKWRVWSPLPSSGGKAGQASAAPTVYDVTLEGVSGEEGPIVASDARGPRIEVALPDAPAAVPAGTAAVSPACGEPIRVAFPRDGSISVGFEPLINGAVRRVELCRPRVVTVTGKADTDEEVPAALAFRRATKIADALRRAGVPAALVRTRTEVGKPSARDPFQNKVVEIGFGGP